MAIGGAGGAIPGITVYAIRFTHQKGVGYQDSKRFQNRLEGNSPVEKGHKYRSACAIASYYWKNAYYSLDQVGRFSNTG